MPFCLGVGTGLVSDLVLLTREMGFPGPAKPLFLQGPILRGAAMGVCSCCIFVANTDSEEEVLADVWSGFPQFSLPSCSVFTCAFALYGDLSEGGGGALLFFPLLSWGLVASLFGSRCMFFWTVISWDPSKSEAHRADADSSCWPRRNSPWLSSIFLCMISTKPSCFTGESMPVILRDSN